MAGVRRLVRIQEHGEVTLPAEVRQKHNFKTGDLVLVEDTDDGVLITARAAEGSMTTEHEPLTIPEPSDEQLALRKALVAQILHNRKRRVITPLTTADLVHLSREDDTWYGPDR
jgi:AbrB family looped-hinge helix DNA binding protein